MASKNSAARVRVGCDPELFLLDAKTGKPVTVCGKLGGAKGKPVPLRSVIKNTSGLKIDNQIGVLEDGVCLEFNMPSYSSYDEFMNSLYYVKEGLERWASENGVKLAYGQSEATFEQADFDRNPELAQIGCSVDFNAYEGAHSRKPFQAKDFGLKRYSGGHIHLGYNVDNVPPYIMARLMDLVVGLPLTMLGEAQKGRRDFYGQAGLYRPKPYGVEYRTPSNLWFKYIDTTSCSYIFANLLRVGQMADTNIPVLKAALAPGALPWEDIRRAITTEDRALSADILRYSHQQFSDLTTTLIMGITSFGSPAWNPEEMEKYKTSKKAKSPMDLLQETMRAQRDALRGHPEDRVVAPPTVAPLVALGEDYDDDDDMDNEVT